MSDDGRFWPAGDRDAALMQAAPVTDLVCPRCRQPPDAWPIDPTTLRCTNPACTVEYSKLPGTEIEFVSAGVFDVEANPSVGFDDENAMRAWVAGLEPGSDHWEQALMVGNYANAHHGQNRPMFSALLDRFIAPNCSQINTAVDLGCGVGAFTGLLARRLASEVIGLDSWAMALRVAEAQAGPDPVHVPTLGNDAKLTVTSLQAPTTQSPPIRWVCGDILDPPLPAGSFDLVTAISVFDSVSNPLVALGQASALLRPGGLLLIAQPDAWAAHVTPPEGWLSSDGEAWQQLMGHYELETIDQEDGFTWVLARGPRTQYRYVSHAMLARRRGN